MNPVCCSARVEWSFGLSSIAKITVARYTSRWAALREAVSRRISASSLVVKDRSFTAFRISFPVLVQENYTLIIRRDLGLVKNAAVDIEYN